MHYSKINLQAKKLHFFNWILMQERMLFLFSLRTEFSPFCALTPRTFQIDISQNQWNKSSFFRTNWQHGALWKNIMYSCMISCCAWEFLFLAFNNMHLIACRNGITEEIRFEICQKISKSNFAIKQ